MNEDIETKIKKLKRKRVRNALGNVVLPMLSWIGITITGSNYLLEPFIQEITPNVQVYESSREALNSLEQIPEYARADEISTVIQSLRNCASSEGPLDYQIEIGKDKINNKIPLGSALVGLIMLPWIFGSGLKREFDIRDELPDISNYTAYTKEDIRRSHND